MAEAINPDALAFIEAEVEKIRFLQGMTDKPGAFLYAQNELLYNRDLSHFQNEETINQAGLPESTEQFYTTEQVNAPHVYESLPRVLNIGSGAEASRKMPAVNVDASFEGKPEVVAEAQHLPFADNSFSVVRASHVLEHIPQEEILDTLQEWKRVLHPDGVLHIAVPDAEVTFQEIINGRTPKGAPAFSLDASTAPLAQIYGLGYNNPHTDERWAHTIIFSYPLLEQYLKAAGFTHIERRSKEEDLANYAGIDDDSQNHYSLLVSASQEKLPHKNTLPLSEKDFREKCHNFLEQYPQPGSASFVIPVYNEARTLRHFLTFLENAENQTRTLREFIFVINGCTDNSESIIREYLEGSYLNARVTHSEKGIMPAFKKGIAERKQEGFIGKLDADTMLHPHALDLMQIFLTENDTVQVTYAEPTPLDSQSAYNEAEHNPILRSKRLYYHGRTSLYRENPMSGLANREIPSELKAEDIFLSFFYIYYKGFDSIACTPHALVFGKTVRNFDDLVTQISRSQSEIKRVYAAYPPFKVLGKALEREIYPGSYRALNEQAINNASEIEGWPQLGSTK